MSEKYENPEILAHVKVDLITLHRGQYITARLNTSDRYWKEHASESIEVMVTHDGEIQICSSVPVTVKSFKEVYGE